MKILHAITLAELGGAQSVVVNLCNQAVEDGHEVFVASGENGEMWDLLSEKVQAIKLKHLQRAISPFQDFQAWLELKRIYREIQPDIIHLHSSKMGALGRLAFPAKKIIYTVHGFDSIRIAFRKFLPIEKILKSQTKYIVAVSHYDKKNLMDEGISNVKMIFNGISDTLVEKNRLIQNVDLENIKKQHKNIIMCIARLASPKRFDLFLEIAKELQNEGYAFVWIGNKTPVNTQGLKNVYLLGEISNAQTLLSYADIFLLPSNYEGLPMSILEALCYGKPVVASAVGGIPEILDGNNGFAVENLVENFVYSIKKINESVDIYQRFSINARFSYEKNFTIREMYKKYLKLYGS
jgi:glycosyltransferase involved in cell wall biosynthesis